MNETIAPQTRQSIIDAEHLRLLAVAHYVSGGLTILFSSLFIFHFLIFFVIGSDPNLMPPPKPGHNQAADQVFRMMGAIIGVFILLGWSFGALTIYVGNSIKRRARRPLSLVVACLNLVFLPVGTLLGVASLIVLTRSSVKQLYDAANDER